MQQDTLIHFQVLQCDSQSAGLDQWTDHFLYAEANDRWQGCTDAQSEYNMYFNYNFIPSPISTLDSIVYTGGFANIHGTDIDYDMHFLLSAQVGDTFHMLPAPYTDIYTKCIFIGEDEVLGQTDSIRRYAFFKDGGSSVLEDRTLVVSKHSGLVAFYHFSELAQFDEGTEPAFFNLLGKETLTDTAGYILPDWNTFLPYYAGDILVWDLQDYAWGVITHRYAKDSITEVTLFPDSLVYQFDRIIKNTDGSTINYPGLRISFDRSVFTNMLQSIPDLPVVSSSGYPWFGLDPNWIWRSARADVSISAADTITNRTFYWSGAQLDTTECLFVWAVDIACDFGMNTLVGVTHFGSHYSDGIGTEWVLIGRTINGVVWGNIDFDAMEVTADIAHNLNIYPNPAVNEIIVSLPSDAEIRYAIYSASGALVQSGTTQNNTLEIQNLSGGLYFITCVQEQKISIGKFVKR
ncbi:MAG: T9SS type A sorting domain-containing protein [Chitinophagales bacterium]